MEARKVEGQARKMNPGTKLRVTCLQFCADVCSISVILISSNDHLALDRFFGYGRRRVCKVGSDSGNELLGEYFDKIVILVS